MPRLAKARPRPTPLPARPPAPQPYSAHDGRHVSVGEQQAPAAAPPAEQERELTDEAAAEVPQPPRVVVPRWVQLVLLPLALLALWALARAAGKVLLVFVVAAVIALILNPAVSFVQRPRVPRGLAVLVVYLAFFLTLAGIGFLLANPISNQVRTFIDNLPHIAREANKTIATVQRDFERQGIHLNIDKQGKTALQTIQDKVAKSASKFVSFGGGLLTEAARAPFDLVLVLVLSVCR